MKELIKNLTSISEALSALTEKVEKMSEAFEKEAVQAKPAKKAAAKKKTAPKAAEKKAAPKKKVAAKKKSAPKKAEPTTKASESGSMLDNIYGLISSGGEGTKVAEIREKTGFTPSQVNNALYKLKKKGKIESISKGVYVKKKS